MTDEENRRNPASSVASVASVASLSHRYGSTLVFDDLSLSVPPGITGLLGVNGVGKTTLLRMVASDLPVQAGSVRVCDQDVTDRRSRATARRMIGYLPQGASWTKSLTVEGFVEYFAWLRRVPARSRASAVDRAISLTSTSALRKRKLSELSGGEHQRVMLAQALVHGPSLLILDEPTAGLDPEQRLAFRTVIDELDDQVSVILSTHLLEDVGGIADHVVVLREGAVAFEGVPTDLAARAWDTTDRSSAMEQGFLRTIRGEFDGRSA